MILLEFANKVIEDNLLERMNGEFEKPPVIDYKCADFDGAQFHVSSTEGSPSIVKISFHSTAAASLLKYGGDALLKEKYGPNFVTAEDGYDATIQYDLDKIGKADRAKVANEASKLKSYLYGSIIIKACEEAEKGGGRTLYDIPLRDSEERMWVRADAADRVTAIFSINFTDADDIIFGKVFLGEFKKSVAGAPSVDFVYKTPPLELKEVQQLPRSENIGYVTFVIFDRHFKGEKKITVAELLPTFRNFLHYHIKCAKSHLHTRMRNRVELLLQVLNRAKQDLDTEKKTASGRTFTRKT
jgi:actin related protein 2/3 complex subunit 2